MPLVEWANLMCDKVQDQNWSRRTMQRWYSLLPQLKDYSEDETKI